MRCLRAAHLFLSQRCYASLAAASPVLTAASSRLSRPSPQELARVSVSRRSHRLPAETVLVFCLALQNLCPPPHKSQDLSLTLRLRSRLRLRQDRNRRSLVGALNVVAANGRANRKAAPSYRGPPYVWHSEQRFGPRLRADPKRLSLPSLFAYLAQARTLSSTQ